MDTAWEKAEMTEAEYYEWLIETTKWHDNDWAAALTIETFSRFIADGKRNHPPVMQLAIEAFICNVWPTGCVIEAMDNAHQTIECGWLMTDNGSVVLTEKEREFSLICYEAICDAYQTGELDELK